MKDKDMDRRRFLKLTLLGSAGVAVGSLFAFGSSKNDLSFNELKDLKNFDWGYVVDTTRCIGCGSCVRACKNENNVPETFYRTWVERYEIDKNENIYVDSPNGAINSFKENRIDPKDSVKGFFVPKICNHCVRSACTQVCPVNASFHTPDGVVLIDKKRCVGCGYCVQACPYGCRYIDHSVGTADKCTLCYHRIHKGKPTACVGACPTGARIYGNLKDPDSNIRRVLHERRYSILKPEMGTRPKCYYIGLDLEVK